jgi:hypothetical protein
MPSPVKVYPLRNVYLPNEPARVRIIPTKAEAEALIASGAFTDNPNDPERDKDAPDDTKPTATAETEAPQGAGPSDSVS